MKNKFFHQKGRQTKYIKILTIAVDCNGNAVYFNKNGDEAGHSKANQRSITIRRSGVCKTIRVERVLPYDEVLIEY